MLESTLKLKKPSETEEETGDLTVKTTGGEKEELMWQSLHWTKGLLLHSTWGVQRR